MDTKLLVVIALSCLAVSITGCTETEVRHFEEPAYLDFCLFQDGDPRDGNLEAGQSAELFAAYDCAALEDELTDSECDVNVEDNVMDVFTYWELSRERQRWGSNVTVPACQPLVISCGEVEGLEEGEYELHHGDDSHEFEVPAETNLDCERWGADIERKL